MATTELIPKASNGDFNSLFDIEPFFGRRSFAPATPWQWIDRLQDELNDMWRRWEHSPAATQSLLSEGMWSPSIDVREGAKHWTVEVDLPGVVKEDVSVEVRGNLLVINAEMKRDEQTQDEKYYRRERKSGKYYRALTLPDDVDSAKVWCNFAKGVLTCRLPKKEGAVSSSHKIPISGS